MAKCRHAHEFGMPKGLQMSGEPVRTNYALWKASMCLGVFEPGFQNGYFQASIREPLLSCQLNLLVWMSQRKLQGHRCHLGFTGPKPQGASSPPWPFLLAIPLITSIPTPGKSRVSLLSASHERAWRTVASWCPPVSKLILTIQSFSYIISFLL